MLKNRNSAQQRRYWYTLLFFCTLAMLLVSFVNVPVSAQSLDQYREYQVKAAFIYNFAKFIEWPPGTFQNGTDPFIIGILGKDPFGGAVDVLREKTVQERTIVIKRFASLEDLGRCHILYISSSERDTLRQVLHTVKDWSVLTVGDMDGFAEAGGIINFISIENKIHFEINVNEAQSIGIKISSQLLKLARIIKR